MWLTQSINVRKKQNKAVATASVACGWAGAVMWGAGAVGGAVYTRASVTCDWAGAVMRKPLAEYMCDGLTDGRTDRLKTQGRIQHQ